ncbi:tripartite tricarboxylate transporter TctB family protein [Paenibacillus sp. S150]|uniref:tripartite tricarboxylate transporter TctB family protein n=1 Tax=Paenibacillus sp. S150 TaxID=2749826 RepID=UPI001C574B4A|nr:tripartite tricarboxylate transporter TctB family protein [Paenibacillus sp. S150]MBW4082755.1 tripartite tricarboxylate transporter TctB family protein [Paenibacillus sp. S150]
MKVKLADRTGAAAAILIGSASIAEAIRLFPYRMAMLNGDHLFPFVVGSGLLVFGLILAFRGDRSAGNHPEAGKDTESSPRTPVLIFAVPVILLFYIALIQWTGYLMATLAASVILFKGIGLFRWYSSLAAALILTVSLYLIFVQWLHAPLPSGRWLL